MNGARSAALLAAGVATACLGPTDVCGCTPRPTHGVHVRGTVVRDAGPLPARLAVRVRVHEACPSGAPAARVLAEGSVGVGPDGVWGTTLYAFPPTAAGCARVDALQVSERVGALPDTLVSVERAGVRVGALGPDARPVDTTVVALRLP